MITGNDIENFCIKDEITSSHEEALKINQSIDIIGYFEDLTKSQIADLLVNGDINLDDSLNYNFSPSSSWYRYVINLRRKSNHLEKAKSLELEQIMRRQWISYEKQKKHGKNSYIIVSDCILINFLLYSPELNIFLLSFGENIANISDENISNIKKYIELLNKHTKGKFSFINGNIIFNCCDNVEILNDTLFLKMLNKNIELFRKYIEGIHQIVDFGKTPEDALSFVEDASY